MEGNHNRRFCILELMADKLLPLLVLKGHRKGVVPGIWKDRKLSRFFHVKKNSKAASLRGPCINVKGGKVSNGQLLLPVFNVKQGVVLRDILYEGMLMLRV